MMDMFWTPKLTLEGMLKLWSLVCLEVTSLVDSVWWVIFLKKGLHRSSPQGLQPIDHFTVVCQVAWPLNENEAGGFD